MSNPQFATRCNCRRKAETSLRCSRCSVPICPHCSKPYPVGMLCLDCAKGKRGGTLYATAVEPERIAVTAVVTLGASVLFGWTLSYMISLNPMSALWGGLFQGCVTAEVNFRVAKRHMGRTSEVISGISAFLGVVGGWYLTSLGTEEGLPFEAYFKMPFAYIMMILAVSVAVMRHRPYV